MSKYSKGWVAFLGFVIEGALLVFHDALGIAGTDLPAILTGVTALTGIGVYRVPNKQPD